MNIMNIMNIMNNYGDYKMSVDNFKTLSEAFKAVIKEAVEETNKPVLESIAKLEEAISSKIDESEKRLCEIETIIKDQVEFISRLKDKPN